MASGLDTMGEVLIIDDDPTILAIVEGALQAAGHQAVPTEDPQRALELLGANAFDAVVLDVVMPQMSGFDVLRTIRKKPHLKTTPVLMLSSQGETSDRVRGLREGADDYVVKPFDLDALVARVERLMAQGTPDTSSLMGRLETFNAADLLQNLSRSRKTGLLRITEGAEETEIYFEEGEILRARQGLLQNEEALMALMEKDSGAFRFEPGTFSDRPPVKPLHLNGILMDAAWLEDEVSQRREFLPTPGAVLRPVADPPALPVDLEALALPYKEVIRLLAEQPPLTYFGLLERNLAAPRKMALTVALLIEAEVLLPETGPAETTATMPRLDPEENAAPPEALTAALTAALTTALANLRRNQPPEHAEETLHFMVFYGPHQWEKLLKLIATIPKEFISADRRRLLDQLAIRNRGTLRLKDPQAEILVHLHPLVTPKRRKDLVFSFVAGVVLWLDPSENLTVLKDLAQILAARACPVGVVSPRVEFTVAMRKSLEDIVRLKWTPEDPQDLADLLQALPLV